MAELVGEQYDLLVEAIRKCFWYKKPLVQFLIRSGVPKSHADRIWDYGSKTEFFRELVEQYSTSTQGREILYGVAISITRMRQFVSLDSEYQIEDAKAAAAALRDSFEELPDELASVIKSQADAISRIKPAKHAQTRDELRTRLTELFVKLGTPEGGVLFEKLICDLARCEDLEVRDPYRVGNSKQVDGSVAVDGNTYLIESKFKKDKVDAPSVREFVAKILESADLTQGVFVSISGYTKPAIEAASKAGSPVILLESDHITNAVFGGYSFERIIVLSKRNASETGQALTRWSQLKDRMLTSA